MSQAAYNPFLPAIEFNEKILTYSSFSNQVNQMAHFLMSIGVSAETLVGVSVNRSFDMVMTVLVILKAGGACLLIQATLNIGLSIF